MTRMIVGLAVFTLLMIFFVICARHFTRPTDVNVDALSSDGCLGIFCYAMAVVCFFVDLMFIIFGRHA